MCGIVGFNWEEKPLLKKMADSIKHRGPDGEGFFCNEQVSLGHRRLAILDLSERGTQPMDFGDYTIVYNGEIYNFNSIKEELAAEGHKFESHCDTEVILHAYKKWGTECVNHLNGMWAFCIYDRKKNILFLSRDRFGIKPLYYYFNGSDFIFASELKAIQKHQLKLKINPKALNFFFYQKYIGGGLTIFENVFKLLPSENLIFDLKKKKLETSRYYILEDKIKEYAALSIKERLKLAKNRLTEAVEKRLIADVKVGSFLSGGVDSSLISGIIAAKKSDFDTFSIGFKEKSYNELEFSKIVADHIKTNHHYKYLDIDQELIRYILDNLDEPYGDSSLLPTYLLSKITREKVTVSLSGDAGDEVFGGYDTYKGYKIARFIPNFAAAVIQWFVNLIPPSDKKVTLAFKIKRFVRDFGDKVCKRHFNWMATFNDSGREKLLGSSFIPAEELINFSSGKDLLDIQLADIHYYLVEDILKKVDTASMLNSLEARVPFLDHELVPLVLSLPEKYKLKGFNTKHFLKKLSSPFIPASIIKRKKRGFTVPVSSWIKNSSLIKEVLTQSEYYTHSFFSQEYIAGLYEEHLGSKKNNARQLWLVFVFNYWYKKNMA